MTRYVYIPLDDFGCKTFVQGLQNRDKHMKKREPRTLLSGEDCLARVDDGDTLYILTHGRVRTPDKIAGVPDENRPRSYLSWSVQSLAYDLVMKGLKTDRWIKLKFYACFSGKMRTNRFELWGVPRSLAGQLYTAMTNMCYDRLIVDGYDGSLVQAAYGKHMIAATRNRELGIGQESAPDNWDDEGNFLVPGFARLKSRRVRFGPIEPTPPNLFPA